MIFMARIFDSRCSIWGVVLLRDAYLAPSGGRGSCLGLRTGVSPHFSTSSKREMLADHERGAAPPPSSPMPDSGAAHTLSRVHTQTAPGDGIGRRRYISCVDVAILPTPNDASADRNLMSRSISSRFDIWSVYSQAYLCYHLLHYQRNLPAQINTRAITGPFT